VAPSRRPGLPAVLARGDGNQGRALDQVHVAPALFAIAMKLESVGIDLETAAAASAILRKHLSRGVRELVDLFVEHVEHGRIAIGDTGELFATFRAAGTDSVRVLFAREMESALRELLSSGKLATLSARARRKKR